MQVVGNCSLALESHLELYNCPYDRAIVDSKLKINGSYSQVRFPYKATLN